jgi:ribonuclease P protein component
MLPAKKRLSVALFTDVIANGKIVHSPFFVARILKAAGENRFSAAISKKIAKTAVERNKLRRRTYSALGGIVGKLKPGFHVVLMAKAALPKATLKDIASDLDLLFVKSGLIK